MRKYTVLICVVEAAAAVFIGYQLLLNQGSAPIPDQPRFSLDPTSELSPAGPDELRVVEELNKSASAIKTLSGKAQFMIKIKRPNQYRLWAEHHFENPRRSRLLLRSPAGLEAEMGSDDQHYWFWFKRKDPKRIFQGPYAQSSRASLFDPVWLKDAIVPANLELRQAKLGKKGDLLVIVRHQDGTTRITIIDEKQGLVIGHYLYDADHQLVAFVDIQEHARVGKHILPKALNGGWPREKTYIYLNLQDQQVNVPIEEGQWDKPAHLDVVDQ